MMSALTTGVGPWILASLGLALLGAIAAAARAWRDSRFSPYYLLRVQAARRLRARALLAGGLLVTFSGAAVLLARIPPVDWPALPRLPSLPVLVWPARSPTPLPSTPAPPTSTRTATAPPTGTPTLSAPPTRSVPRTPGASLSATPARTLPQAFLTPVAPLATPSADADFGPILLGPSVSDFGYPTVITDTYRTGRFSVYAVFTHTHMTAGVAWTQLWLRNGMPVRGETALWSYKPDGRIYVFVNPTEGWLPGDYEVQLFIGERLTQFAPFRVLP